MITTIWAIAGLLWLSAAKNWYEAGRPHMVGLSVSVAILNFFVAYLYF